VQRVKRWASKTILTVETGDDRYWMLSSVGNRLWFLCIPARTQSRRPVSWYCLLSPSLLCYFLSLVLECCRTGLKTVHFVFLQVEIAQQNAEQGHFNDLTNMPQYGMMKVGLSCFHG
jgi:hypothetical protein